jgi:AcrR family transcriptional regulator
MARNTEAPSAFQGEQTKAGMERVLPARPARKPRADSVRNRERVLEAAKLVFAAGGPDGSLEAVARQAGVGIGTLYRHFPTREALFEAVYRHEVEQLVELAEQLGTDLPPLEALRRWMHASVAFVATKKGMSAALAVVVHASSDLTVYSMDRLGRALETLLRRAVNAKVIRQDIGAEDVLRTIVGLCYTHDKPGWQGNVLRLVDVFVDGMRRGAP